MREELLFSARQSKWRASRKFPDRHKNDTRLLDDVMVGRTNPPPAPARDNQGEF
jgi:hypothetical protein